MNTFTPGSLFEEQYIILELLGEGGFGEVYKAREKNLERTVAIKVLRDTIVPDFVKRFRREGKILASLNHPHILQLYRFGLSKDKSPYLVTEYVTGTSLREKINSEHVSIQQALQIAVQICGAMQFAHNVGVVHRDLKPDNVMLIDSTGDDYNIKIIDFGLSRCSSATSNTAGLRTGTGEILGSPPYMSPEQWLGKPADQRSDIYSLGCILFELIAGHPPFQADTPMQVMFKHANEIPKLPSNIREQTFPVGLEVVLQHSLAKVPSTRIQSMAEFQRHLESVLSGNGTSFTPASKRQRVLPPSYVVWGVISLLILAVAGTAALLSSKRVPVPASRVKMKLPEPLKPSTEINRLSPIEQIEYYNDWIKMHPSAVQLDSFEAHRSLATALHAIDPSSSSKHVRAAHKILLNHLRKTIDKNQALEVTKAIHLLSAFHLEVRERSRSDQSFPNKACLTADLEQMQDRMKKSGESDMLRALNSCRAALAEEYKFHGHYAKGLAKADEALKDSDQGSFDPSERFKLLQAKLSCLSRSGRKRGVSALLKKCVSAAHNLVEMQQLVKTCIEMEEWNVALKLCNDAERMYKAEKRQEARTFILMDERTQCLQKLNQYREAFSLFKEKLATVSGSDERLYLWPALANLDAEGGLGESTALSLLLKDEINNVSALTPVQVNRLLKQIVVTADVALQRNERAVALTYLRLIFVIRTKWKLSDYQQSAAGHAIECATEFAKLREFLDTEDILRETNWRICDRSEKHNQDLLAHSYLHLMSSLSESMNSPAEGLIVADKLDKLDLNKDLDFRLLTRALFYQQEKRYREARATILEILSSKQVHHQTKTQALTHLAAIEADEGNDILAEKNLKLALQSLRNDTQPKSLATLFKAATVYAQIKQSTKAAKCVNRYIDIAMRGGLEHLPHRLMRAAEMCDSCGMVDRSAALRRQAATLQKESAQRWIAQHVPHALPQQ